jgi:hypothetical protein
LASGFAQLVAVYCKLDSVEELNREVFRIGRVERPGAMIAGRVFFP